MQKNGLPLTFIPSFEHRFKGTVRYALENALRNTFALLFVLVASATGCGADHEDASLGDGSPDPSRDGSEGQDSSDGATADPLYLAGAWWPRSPSGTFDINVCWETVYGAGITHREDHDSELRGIIRAALQQSWQAVSSVRFVGFSDCPTASAPGQVRVRFTEGSSDGGSNSPRASVGYSSTGARDVRLLYTYESHWAKGRCAVRGLSWQSCTPLSGGCPIYGYWLAENDWRQCAREYAVHEFGHILGFAHEQARPDTPDSCTDKDVQGGASPFGVWDDRSVMNYCGPNRLGGGVLSSTDAAGARWVYPSFDAPPPPSLKPIAVGRPSTQWGIPLSDYQAVFNFHVARGYVPSWVNAFNLGAAVYVNSVFESRATAVLAAVHNVDGVQYQDWFNQRVAEGYRPRSLDSYLVDNRILYAAIFEKASGPGWVAYHGLRGAEAQQNKHDTLRSQGYRPLTMSETDVDGEGYFSGVWVHDSTRAWDARWGLSSSSYQSVFNADVSQGKRLAFINAADGSTGGVIRLIGIWVAPGYGNATTQGWWPAGGFNARHDLSGSNLTAELVAPPYTTRAVVGYANGSLAAFAGLWSPYALW